MAIKHPPVDVVLVGLGWTGSIMGMEMTDAGLQVLALERGEMQDTPTTANYPNVIDELAYTVRGKLYQDLARETVTFRHNISGVAVPYRQHGSILLGTGVGGSGFHWNGLTWRAQASDLRLRSHYEERYGKHFIPQGMTIQDFGVSYEELEPYFARFEAVAGIAGKAGNLNGTVVKGGNRFEAPRSSEFPLPALKDVYGAQLFAKAARELGYEPFPIPAANASEPYTNPYGVRMGPCNFCGFCENYGCYMYSKGSPQTTILPVLLKRPNFKVKTQAQVIKVNLDSSGKLATGVTYIDAQGREVEQPAQLVILTAFQLHNVRLLLLSGIGKPYDPVIGDGVVGKNYAYQMNGGVSVMLPKGTQLNPFIGAGAGGQAIDDFNGDNFDHAPLGFLGGANIRHNRTGGRPIGQATTPKAAPKWGKGWKAATQDSYQRLMGINAQGSVMAYRDSYLSLDPTYRDAYGQPLLRITFDWHDNEFKMTQYTVDKAQRIAEVLGGSVENNAKKPGSHYDTRVYQSTHTTGGAIMGSDPASSVVNRFLQCWDVHNVFVTGASAFPQNFGYNPTGLVGALTYWAAHHIREHYLPNPGPMVQA
ncbi:GMC family oxidoreductase [Pseudomonas sp. GD03651]|jgi:gluconate 2-dehydrogenase alpha chain|uniref:GMC family oxidoreductase n=1 Tax=Pseudomonas TaxID=286 RepID=UPI00034EF5C8|nr:MULTISPECIES: GMC family oxidoreductase [Pseudomonas]AGN78840.1 GMC family oxidoreductase [Pseudomonas putida H8234]MDH2182434.1 GMC family oxidoreductase [Pseudomonas sp. GD03651]MDO1495930.1 GMC family oxidoreductase [Pseudomonas putida]HDS1811426.1 GMC family oxidoreductase [Pseudomonas putida]HDS3807762.1 GMC family oxidoreductase [Pseudomonas putida]